MRALDPPNALVPRSFADAMQHLAEVKQRLEKDAFDVVARVESDDPGSKMRGGDLGWFQRRAKNLRTPRGDEDRPGSLQERVRRHSKGIAMSLSQRPRSRVIIALAGLTVAPVAPWSSDRGIANVRPPIFRRVRPLPPG